MDLKFFRLSISIILILFVWLLGKTYAEEYDRNVLIKEFNKRDFAIDNGEGYSKQTNDEGNLAWAESYLLEAYLEMYEATSEEKYLQQFVRHADRILQNTDRERKIMDYKGRSAVGWSTTIYSKNKERVVHMVHTGMITYPLMRFVSIIIERNLVQFSSHANAYLQITEEAVAFFDPNWKYDNTLQTWHYEFSPDDPTKNATPAPMPLPLNQQLAFGRCLILLHKITGKQSYYDKAESLAGLFKKNLIKKQNGSYVWKYWYGNGLKILDGIENISYGAMNVDFAVLAYKNGIVFTQEDIESFVKTYTKNIIRGGKYADVLDGSGEGTYKNAIGRWLVLADFDNSIWKSFFDLVVAKKVSGREAILGIGKLIHYCERHKSFNVCR